MAVMRNGVQVGRLTKEQKRIDEEKLARDWENGGRLKMQMQAIDEQYADGAPYEKGCVENEARFYMGQSAQAMFELGKRLLLLKEHEPHGEFLNSLERIGIEERSARRMMQATIKISKRTSMSVLEPTKIYSLAMLDNEVLDELEQGGTVAGLKLDEVDRMTTRELRAEVRKLKEVQKESEETHEQILADKDKKINEYARDLKQITKPEGWAKWANEFNEHITEAHNKAQEAISQFWAVCGKLEKVYSAKDYDATDGVGNALPLCAMHLQWASDMIRANIEVFVERMKHRVPIPWHPINMSKEEITRETDWEAMRAQFPYTMAEMVSPDLREYATEAEFEALVHEGEE